MRIIHVFLAAVFTFASTAQAGFWGLTHHSRANCINNESISWHFGHNYDLKVVSLHELFKKRDGLFMHVHEIIEDWSNTWRSAAVHWGEESTPPWGTWRVLGIHYMKNEDGHAYVAEQKSTWDCSQYDGWWDK